jgi:putative oxidoreductase
MAYGPDAPHLNPWPSRIAWGLQILAAAAFIAAAGAKLSSVPLMVETFDKIGVGQWLRYVTATVEVAGGFALLTQRTAPWGAFLLGATMVGAVIPHVAILQMSPIGAIILLAVVLAIAWLRRDQFLSLVKSA